MRLVDKLNEDFEIALKNRDNIMLSVLRLVKTAITNLEKQGQTKIENSHVQSLIQKELKQREDSIAQIGQSRPELVENDKKVIEILKKYLPAQLSDDELKEIIDNTIKELKATQAKDIGKVIGAVMGKTKGQAQAATVVQLVKDRLK